MRLPDQEHAPENRGVFATMGLGISVLWSAVFSSETAPKEKPGITNQIQVELLKFDDQLKKLLSEFKDHISNARITDLAIKAIVDTVTTVATANTNSETVAKTESDKLRQVTKPEIDLIAAVTTLLNQHHAAIVVQSPNLIALTVRVVLSPYFQQLESKRNNSAIDQKPQDPPEPTEITPLLTELTELTETGNIMRGHAWSIAHSSLPPQPLIEITSKTIMTLAGVLLGAMAAMHYTRARAANEEAERTRAAKEQAKNDTTLSASSSKRTEPAAFPPTLASIPVEPTTVSTTSSSRDTQFTGILKRSPSSTPNKKAAASTQKKIAAVASQQQELLLLHDNMQIFPIFFLRNLMSATAPTLLLPRMTQQHSANRSQRSTTTLPSYVNHNAQSQEQLKQSTTLPLLLMDKPADESATQNEPTVFMPISAENAVRLFLLNSQIQQNLLQPSGIIAPRHSVMSNERTTAANGGPEITINTTVLPTSQSFDATSIDPKNKKQKRNNKNKKIKNEKQLAVAQLKAQQEEQLFDKKLAAIVSELAERQTTLETEKNKKRKLKKVQQEKKERKKLATKRKKLAAEFVDNLLAPFLDDSKTQQAQQDTNNIEQNITDTMKIVHTLSASRSATLTDQQKEKIDDVTRQITEFDQEVQNADGDHHAPTEASRGEQRMVGSPSTVSADSSLDSKYNAAQQTVNQDYPEGSSRFERPVFWSIPRDRLNFQAGSRNNRPEHDQTTAANAGPTVSTTTKTIKRSDSVHDLMPQNTQLTIRRNNSTGNFNAAERSFNTVQSNTSSMTATAANASQQIRETPTTTVAANPAVPNDHSNNGDVILNERDTAVAVTAGSEVSTTIVTGLSLSAVSKIKRQRETHRENYTNVLTYSYFYQEAIAAIRQAAEKQACADMPFFMEPTREIIEAKKMVMLAGAQSNQYTNNDPQGKLLFQLEAVEKELMYLNEIYKERSARAHRCHGIGRLFCIFNLQAEYKTTFNKKAEAEKMLTEINRLRSVLEKTSSTATIWTAGAASCQDKNSRLNLLGDKLRYLQKEITSLQNNAAASVSVARAGQLH